MAKKLTRAVKGRATWNGYTEEWIAYGLRFPASEFDKECYIVPAAEYERLTRKAAKRAKKGAKV